MMILFSCFGHSESKNKEDEYKTLRLQMVDQQIIRRDITDPNVLEAMRTVPRHLFVPEGYRNEAS